MTILDIRRRPDNRYRKYRFYRDAFDHMTKAQRVELREEYRFLRQMHVSRDVAKGTIFRTVTAMQGWV